MKFNVICEQLYMICCAEYVSYITGYTASKQTHWYFSDSL